MGKYNNNKTKIGEIIFDSKDEATYYLDLLDMKKNGIVEEIQLQPKFTLVPSFKKYNKTIAAITYKPDFKVVYCDGIIEYIDVKGFETESSILRKKLFDYFYPDLTLKWLVKNNAYGDKYGWITKDDLKKIISKNKRKNKLPK